MRLRFGSSRVGCRLDSKKTSKLGLRSGGYFMKAKKCGLAPIHGLDAEMGSDLSSLGAPAPEALLASFPKFKDRSSLVIFAPEMLMEKPSMSSSLEASLVSSTDASSVSEGFGARSWAVALGERPIVLALVRPALGWVPPLSPSSKVYSGLLDMGVDQYVLPEMAPSPAPVGMGPAPGDYSSGADALDERLRYSLLVMSKSSAPIFPSESKSVLKDS
jgi:hypothetical protein